MEYITNVLESITLIKVAGFIFGWCLWSFIRGVGEAYIEEKKARKQYYIEKSKLLKKMEVYKGDTFDLFTALDKYEEIYDGNNIKDASEGFAAGVAAIKKHYNIKSDD